MKFFLAAFLFLSIVSCGGGSTGGNGTAGSNAGGANNAGTTPTLSDITASMSVGGTGPSRSVQIAFQITPPTVPGEKSVPKTEVLKVTEARFNDTSLAETEAGGRTVYGAEQVQITRENFITMKHNGKTYETKYVPLTGSDTTGINLTMTAK